MSAEVKEWMRLREILDGAEDDAEGNFVLRFNHEDWTELYALVARNAEESAHSAPDIRTPPPQQRCLWWNEGNVQCATLSTVHSKFCAEHQKDKYWTTLPDDVKTYTADWQRRWINWAKAR